ncbi:MAG: B12-binding domain-containing radical SAM protein [Terriglobales bacterium]
MSAPRTIVLFYPPYSGPALSAPLSLLCLAAPLLEAGFPVRLVDAAVTPDFEAVVMRAIPDALCLGISMLTGPMIQHGARLARRVKQMRPELPIILGGWHPSLLPDQSLEPDYVDMVVRRQGERTLLEIAERLAAGRGMEEVAGVSFKRNGAHVHNPDRPLENINRLTPPAYHLADFDAYARLSGVRKAGYASSIGCPYACNYCTDMVFYQRRFNAYKAGRVVGEVVELVRRHGLEEVALLDSNFLVDGKRAIEIAEGFIASGERFRWTFQASTDLLCRLSDADVGRLAASGVSHMGFGTESASEGVLLAMNKKHQRVEEMFETARKADQAGIRVTFNLILGYPGETEADRLHTFRVMSDIARRYGVVSFSPNIFTPYPGIPIWPQLRTLGVHEPGNLEAWADLPLGRNILPWLQGEERRRLRRMLEYFLLNNQIRRAAQRSRWFRARRRVLGAPLRWRLRVNRFGFPWELWLARATEGVVSRRSLLTGQSLSHSMEEAC